MAKRFLIVLRHAPYGRLDAAEAVRHLNGAAAEGLDTALLLQGDGVYLTKASQAPAPGWTDLSAALAQALRTAEEAQRERGRVEVYVAAGDLASRGLGQGDLVSGCQLADESVAAELLARADATLVY